tara:strand:- start:3 stop:728 length:726 start_codon:yes stop_codon:yes gene_type:complete
MPTPHDDEEQDQFIHRCMSDDTMKTDIPENNVRLAVCFRQWDEAQDEDNAMKSDHETRAVRGLKLSMENRDAEGDLPTITGYAAVYGKPSVPLPFREVIRAGAFDRNLEDGQDVRALIDHDPGRIIGRSKPGTLKMTSDDHGLKVAIDPPNTAEGRGVVESIRRGDLDGMSFGFRTVTDEWRMEDGEEVRDLIDVDLFDVSVVAFPAYPDTSVGARSLERWRQQQGTPRLDAARLRTASMR